MCSNLNLSQMLSTFESKANNKKMLHSQYFGFVQQNTERVFADCRGSVQLTAETSGLAVIFWDSLLLWILPVLPSIPGSAGTARTGSSSSVGITGVRTASTRSAKILQI